MSQDWRRSLVKKLKRWAEERFPILFPVRVYLRPAARLPEMLGYFLLDDDMERGVIVLRDSLDRSGLIETFTEEWAHARCAHLIDLEDDDEDTDHHQTFWSEFGRITKAAREMDW
jgi:hypothetical protein